MQLTRTDTGEIIDSRKMTEEERQESLPLAEPAKKEKKNA